MAMSQSALALVQEERAQCSCVVQGAICLQRALVSNRLKRAAAMAMVRCDDVLLSQWYEALRNVFNRCVGCAGRVKPRSWFGLASVCKTLASKRMDASPTQPVKRTSAAWNGGSWELLDGCFFEPAAAQFLRFGTLGTAPASSRDARSSTTPPVTLLTRGAATARRRGGGDELHRPRARGAAVSFACRGDGA